jgi:hypothetical protein
MVTRHLADVLAFGVADEREERGTNRQNAKTPEEGERKRAWGFALAARSRRGVSRATGPNGAREQPLAQARYL